MTKGRLEAFSDGVFAIAITLLALTLPLPGSADGLAPYLAQHWTSYAAYLASFFIIGIIWLNHHGLISAATRVDRRLTIVNLLLLLAVVTIPYVTNLLATYLRSDNSSAHLAAALYSAVTLAMAVTITAMFELIHRSDTASGISVDPATLRRIRRRFGAGQVVYAAAIVVSFVSAPATLALQFITAVYYLFDHLPAAATADDTAGSPELAEGPSPGPPSPGRHPGPG